MLEWLATCYIAKDNLSCLVFCFHRPSARITGVLHQAA